MFKNVYAFTWQQDINIISINENMVYICIHKYILGLIHRQMTSYIA